MGGGFGGALAAGELKEITKEGLSEYFLYTIEGTETIPNQWAKRLPSFEMAGIPVTSLYKYDEERWGNQPIRFLAFANDKEHQLGETPLPDGRIRVFGRINEASGLSYIGSAAVKYIPVDEEVELNLGAARQVTVGPRLMDLRTEHHRFDQNGDLAGWDEIQTWEIEINNTREIPVKLELTRGFDTAYWGLETDDGSGYEKHDATHARFTVELPRRSTRTQHYVLSTYRGSSEGAQEKK